MRDEQADINNPCDGTAHWAGAPRDLEIVTVNWALPNKTGSEHKRHKKGLKRHQKGSHEFEFVPLVFPYVLFVYRPRFRWAKPADVVELGRRVGDSARRQASLLPVSVAFPISRSRVRGALARRKNSAGTRRGVPPRAPAAFRTSLLEP